MKKVLIFAKTSSQKVIDFCKKLESSEKMTVSVWNFDDVNMRFGKNSNVFNQKTNEKLSDFDKIFTFSTPEHEKIHIFSAIGNYAKKNNIEMYDDTFTNTSGKLYEMSEFYANDLKIPETFFGTRDFIKKSLQEIGIGIFKTTHGAKGRGNYLVSDEKQIDEILDENPEKTFILQNFVKNVGDYRVIVIGDKARMVIYRSSNGKDHRNNTSLGGAAKIVPMEKADKRLIDMAEKAARVTKIGFAGVDIMQSAEDGEYYLLEINRTPQFASGTFVDEKAELMQKILLND